MNIKTILLPILGLLLVLLATVVILKTLSPEDNWICQNGSWVKHGNPSGPMPTGTCESGEQANPPTQTTLPNPASQNCLQKGGRLEIVKETAGEYGLCKFPDGTECEEWKLFRDECKQGQSHKADVSHPYRGFISQKNGEYVLKSGSVEYSLKLPSQPTSELKERLAAEAKGNEQITVIASETPPLSKILILQGFQEK